MSSELAAHVDDYLAMRRALGYQLHEPERLLHDLVTAVERLGQAQLSVDAILTWAVAGGAVSRGQAARRLSTARRFAVYLAALDPTTQVPPANLLPGGAVRATPYIFTADEVWALIAAARRLSPALRAASMATFIGLLAATGLRPGEARRLDHDDVDPSAGLLIVRNTKLGKTRIVPLDVTTTGALARYARRRDRLCPHPTDPAFLLASDGTRLTATAVTATFRRLRDQAGITVPPGRRAARPHDLRHTFAVDTIADWHAAGVDVQRQLPLLAHRRRRGPRDRRARPLPRQGPQGPGHATEQAGRATAGRLVQPAAPDRIRHGLPHLQRRAAEQRRRRRPARQTRRRRDEDLPVVGRQTRHAPHAAAHRCDGPAASRRRHHRHRALVWLGHASTRSTNPYLHADLTIKEAAPARTAPHPAARQRYRPADTLLAFLENL